MPYSREKAESKEHEQAGFKGGCPFPHAEVRMTLRDMILSGLGMTPDERDADFLEDEPPRSERGRSKK